MRNPIALLLIVLLVASAALYSEIFLNQKNTLHQNGRWISTKTGLEKGVVGAAAFMITRRALSGNKLDLGTWHGLNEVVYKEELRLREASFDFKLEGKAHVIFEYNRSGDGFSGLRLSRSQNFAHLIFKADLTGAFRSKQPLGPLALRDGWNHVRAEFAQSGTTFYINGALAAHDPRPATAPQKIGFRSSIDPTLIDNIRLVGADGTAVLRETFANRNGFTEPFSLATAGLLLIAALLIFSQRRDPKAALFTGIMFQLSLLSIGAVYYAADYFWLSRAYPTSANWIDYVVRQSHLAQFRENIEHEPEVSAKLKRIPSQKPAHITRIMFVGSSQTWGAGAQNAADTFVERLGAQLAAVDKHIDWINVSISGWNSETLFGLYEKDWNRFNPDLMVINLSNNDYGFEDFERGLTKFLEYNKKRGARTILVFEANYLEANTARLLNNHAIMQKLAKKYGLNTIDLHQAMIDRRDEGLAWWDEVHMSSFGQELAAEAMFPVIAKELQSFKKSRL